MLHQLNTHSTFQLHPELNLPPHTADSSPLSAMANLFLMKTAALFDSPVIPVGVPV